MARITVDDCLKRIPNRFQLTLAATYRARQVRAIYPDCVGIFILPPSIEELERRMRARGQDSDAVIRRRLDNARGEMDHAGEFDYAIINKDFQTAQRELAEIIQKERAKAHGAHHR